MIILLFVMPEFPKDHGTVWLALVIFLAALWIAGAGTMTFKDPYKNTSGNGYFGAWIATFCAVTLMSEALQELFADLKAKLAKGEAWNWWFILTAASLVAMVQSAIDCDEAAKCEKELAWTLACSTISLVLCIVMIVLVLACEQQMSATVWKWMSLGLVVWWLAGVGVSTYKKGPYLSAGNGYFSVWIALIASCLLFGILFFTENGEVEAAVEDTAKKAMEGVTGYISALFLFSLAVLIAAAILCDEKGECKKFEGWAVAASAISVAITLFLLIASFVDFLGEAFETTVWVCAVVLLAVWMAGTYTMTFESPFVNDRGNGYFGAWLSLIVAWWFATAVTPQLKEAMAKLTQWGGWAYQVLAIASLIVGVQAAHDCNKAGSCTDNNVAMLWLLDGSVWRA